MKKGLWRLGPKGPRPLVGCAAGAGGTLRAYRAAGVIAAPALRFMLRRRAGAGKELLDRLPERVGIASLPRPPGRLVWIHTASVGETMSVLPLIDALAGQAAVLLTTGTVTSAALAAARLPPCACHQFVPLDVAGWVGKFYAHWRPDCAVFIESEIWPALLAAADAGRVPRLLLNARLSTTSLRRWRRAPGLARQLFGGFAHVAAQSTADSAAYAALGVRDVKDWGDLKVSADRLPVDEAALAALRTALPGPLWLAASTHEGEDELAIAVHRTLAPEFPGLTTIIAPRHPGRGAAIAGLADGLKVARRSLGAPPCAGGIYVADTLGELGLFYRLAPFAFVGKSLAGGGGHNVIEPALLGRPVISGPRTENFVAAVGRLRDAGGLVVVADLAGLRSAVRAWLADPAAAATAGEAAARAFAQSADLPGRLARLILETL